MEYTKNYHLPQWVETDRILMEDFNQMCVNIEEGISTVQKATKASQETADQAKATAEAAATFIGSAENCRICAGSYVGTDLCGAENPSTLEFPFYPLLVILREADTISIDSTIFIRGSRYANNHQAGTIQSVTWNEKSISWYANAPAYQLNDSANTYAWVAFGCSAE